MDSFSLAYLVQIPTCEYNVPTLRAADSPDLALGAIAAHPALKGDEEPVTPSRVVPQIFLKQLVGVSDLAVPNFPRGEQSSFALSGGYGGGSGPEMHEDPLSVRPSVVIFGVESECLGCEVELAGRIVEREDNGPAVLPVHADEDTVRTHCS